MLCSKPDFARPGILLVLSALTLTGCASIDNEAIKPTVVAKAQNSASVAIAVTLGPRLSESRDFCPTMSTGFYPSGKQTAATFKAALASSISETHLFASVTNEDQADYLLTARFLNYYQGKPWSMHGDFFRNTRVEWTLKRQKDQQIVYQASLRSTCVTPLSYSFFADARAAHSRECALKDAMEKGLGALENLQL